MSAFRVGISFVSIAAIFFGSGCGENADGDYRQYSANDRSLFDASTPDSPPVNDHVNSESSDASIASPDVSIGAENAETVSNPNQGSDNSIESHAGVQESTEGSTTDVSKTVGKKKVELVSYEPIQVEQRSIKLLIPEKDFQADGEGVIRISYDDIDLLKVLNMEPVPTNAADYFPKWLKDLNGKRIRIRGFMFPPPRRTGIEYFQLARDNEICCFGKQAKIYDKFPVEMRKGVTTHYIFSRPFDVVGKFMIDPFEDEGELFELFRIEDAIIIEK